MNEESLFAAALDLPATADRRAFLDEACAGDVRLRRRLERLLAADMNTRGILDHGPDTASVLGACQPQPLAAEQLFAGRFRLREKLGEGGMGEVWVADQQEPVRRRVALKVIRAELGTARLLSRFDQERQALALMDHPNIAKVLDAGVANGRPFFVMELIEGVPITEYCDNAGLSPRERLKLFLSVCGAVQHAHQKGIIHRDLKPSNILVGLYDGKPMPKVIDFGIAKAAGQRLCEHNVSTEVGTLIGTLEYMSPEQADLNSLDVDTRSDVYALGIVLYELLTGTVPFSAERLRSIPFDEMLRIIREVEPPRPSARLSESRKRKAVLRGELDWIVMKCLEKNRDRRYKTANDLALDLERYLNDEPVAAGPPSPGYRFRKFLRRNRRHVLGASLVLLVLLGGIVGTTVGLARAVQAKVMAEKRLLQIQKGIDLLSSIFEDLDPRAEQEDRPLRDMLADRLVRAAADLEGETLGDPLLVAALQDRLGLSLLRLGRARQAIGLFASSRATRAAILGPEHPDTLHSMNNLARGYHDAGQLPKALPLLEETLRLRKIKLGDDHRDTLKSMNNLASGYCAAGKPEQALPLLRETLRLRRAKLGPYHQETLTSMNNLAVVHAVMGKFDLALPLDEETLKLRGAKLGPYHADTLQSMQNLGCTYRGLRMLKEAVSLHEKCLRVRRSRLGERHPHTFFAMHALASTYLAAHQYEKARSLFEETLQLRRDKLGVDHPDTLVTMHELAKTYQELGKPDQALSLFQQAAAGVEKRQFAHRRAGQIILDLCRFYERQNQYEQAEDWRRKWLAVVKKKHGPESAAYARELAGIGSNLLGQNKHQAAVLVLREGLAILGKKQPDVWETSHAQSLLGTALLGQKNYQEAEPLLVQGYKGMKKMRRKGRGAKPHSPPTDEPLIEVLERLVQLYDAWNKPELAAAWRKELEAAKTG